MTTDTVLYEAFCLWPAWSVLVGHVSRAHPADACPHSIHGSLLGADHDRLAALLYAHGTGDTLAEAADVLDDLILMCRDGARPRFGAECGLTRQTLLGLMT